MQRYCHFCARKLRGLRMWCPDCRRSTIGWLHVALIAALDAAGLVYLLRLFCTEALGAAEAAGCTHERPESLHRGRARPGHDVLQPARRRALLPLGLRRRDRALALL